MNWRRHQLFVPAIVVLLFSALCVAAPVYAQSNEDPNCAINLKLIERVDSFISDRKLGDAEAVLQAVDPQACDVVSNRLADLLVDLALAKQKLRQDLRLAIVECRVADMAAIRKQAAQSGLVLPLEETQRISNVTNGLQLVGEKMKLARQQLNTGSLAAGDLALQEALATLNDLRGESECADFRNELSTLKDSSASLRQLLDQGQDALAQCRSDAINRHKNTLLALDQRPNEVSEQLALINQTLRHLRRIQLASKLSQKRIQANNYRAAVQISGKALALLDGDTLNQCDGLRDQLAEEHDRKEQFSELLEQSSQALATCSLAQLRTARVGLLRVDEQAMVERKAHVEQALGLALAMQAAERKIEARQFRQAQSELETLTQTSKDRHAEICPNLDARIETLLSEQLDLNARLSMLLEAKDACHVDDIAQALQAADSDEEALAPARQELKQRIARIRSFHQLNQVMPVRLRSLATLESFHDMLKQWEEDPDGIDLAQQCPQLTTKRQQVINDSWELHTLLQQAEQQMSTSCMLAEMDLAAHRDRFHGMVLFETYYHRQSRLKAALEPVFGQQLETVLKGKDFDAALKLISTALEAVDQKPGGYCASNGQPLRPELAKLDGQLRKVLKGQAQIQTLEGSCDMSAIAKLKNQFRTFDNDRVFPVRFNVERERLANIETRCRARKRTEQRIAMGKVCRNRLGRHYRVIESGSNLRCGCLSPYVLNSARNACQKPRSLVVKEAHAACLKKYGGRATAFDIKPDGSSRCRCGDGYVLNSNQTRCYRPTGAALKRFADNGCVREYGKLSRSVQVVSATNYRCECRPGARWTKNQDRCYRPSQKQLRNEAIADCRKQYGKRFLHVSRRKNGQYLCHYKYPRAQALRWCRKTYGSKVRTVRFNKSGSKYWCIFR